MVEMGGGRERSKIKDQIAIEVQRSSEFLDGS